MDEIPKETYQLKTYVERMKGEDVLPGHAGFEPTRKWREEIGNIISTASMAASFDEFEGTEDEWLALNEALEEKKKKYNVPDNPRWGEVMEKIRQRCDTRNRE